VSYERYKEKRNQVERVDRYRYLIICISLISLSMVWSEQVSWNGGYIYIYIYIYIYALFRFILLMDSYGFLFFPFTLILTHCVKI